MATRELSITIEAEETGSAYVNIYDNESSDDVDFPIPADVNCNDADELAKGIGYEILSWVDIMREETKL